MVYIVTQSKPTAINKRGTKIPYKEYIFDSKKEFTFFKDYIENCGYKYEVHPQYILMDKFNLDHTTNIRGVSYKPDFVVYNDDGSIKHVYDVKNGFSVYDIDTGVNLRFKMFEKQFNIPVEVAVVRKNKFKVKILGTTKKFAIKELTSVDYNWQELFD